MSDSHGQDGEEKEETPLWERLVGWGNSALHTAGHVGVKALEGLEGEAEGVALAAEGESGFLSKLGPMGAAVGKLGGKYLPWVGTGIGVGQFGYHAHEAANTEDNGNYVNNQHWNQVGEASLGAIGAAASWCPPAALYLGAGEIATDALGWGAGMTGEGINSLFGTNLDLGFSAGSMVGGIEHAASNLSVKNSPIIGNAMMAACPGLGLAANAGDLVTGSGQLIESVGHGIGEIKDWAGEKATNAGHAIGDMATNAYHRGTDLAHRGWEHATDAYHGAQDLGHRAMERGSSMYNSTSTTVGNMYNSASNTVGNAWNSASTAASDAWHHPAQTAQNAYNSASKTASSAWNRVKSWF